MEMIDAWLLPHGRRRLAGARMRRPKEERGSTPFWETFHALRRFRHNTASPWFIDELGAARGKGGPT